jgi:hypothetical protein
MRTQVENLVLYESGATQIAEADFEKHRINVRCVYDDLSRSWGYDVFLLEAGLLRRLSGVPSRLHAASRFGAVHMGMQFALNDIRGLPQGTGSTYARLPPLSEVDDEV